MHIPRTFKTCLWRAYTGEIDLDDLIKDQEHFLRALARYSLRYKTTWYMSDEDDLFQEACIWMIRSMWEWDESRGRSLEEYVIYNIGARLATQIKVERAKRRHPDANTSRKLNIWESSYDDNTLSMESMIAGNGPNPELIVILREAIEIANENLTDLAKDLLIALAENNGNLTWATRDLMERDHIRRRFGPDENHLKYVLRQKVMPEIFHFLNPMAIMPQ